MKDLNWNRICYLLIILSLFHQISCKHLPTLDLEENGHKGIRKEDKNKKLNLCSDLNTSNAAEESTTVGDSQTESSNSNDTSDDCFSTEYRAYVKCLRQKRLKKARGKRQTGCIGNNEATCDTCGTNCQNTCASCQGISCRMCDSCSNCQTTDCCEGHCQKMCATNICQRGCQTHCYEEVKKKQYLDRIEDIPQSIPTIVIKEKEDSKSEQSSISEGGTNITTIIHLHNIVNNTNNIDMPIEVKGSSLNNITIYGLGSQDGGQVREEDGHQAIQSDDSGISKHNDCCHIVLPIECKEINQFPFRRCFHRRRRSCGPHCQSQTLHLQKQGEQLHYIPQPNPRCVYSPVWPYVTCGHHHRHSHQLNCDGCYNHYPTNSQNPIHTTCPYGCYDQGYGTGPYYRKGPFYQPVYMYVPTCSQTATCGSNGNTVNGINYTMPYPMFNHNHQSGYIPQPYQPKTNIPENTDTLINNHGEANATTLSYYPQNNLYYPPTNLIYPQNLLNYPQNNLYNPQNSWMYPQNNFMYPQNNFMYPQNNFMYPQNNFMYPQNNFMYPQTNGFYPQYAGYNPLIVNPFMYQFSGCGKHSYPEFPIYLFPNVHTPNSTEETQDNSTPSNIDLSGVQSE